MSLKVGDVVRLKSGGPAMTVDQMRKDRDGTEIAHTVWYAGNHELRYSCLPVDAFVKVPDGPA